MYVQAQKEKYVKTARTFIYSFFFYIFWYKVEVISDRNLVTGKVVSE